MTNITISPITFEINGKTYSTNGNGYYYVTADDRKTRIKQAEFEAAYGEYVEKATEAAEESTRTEEALEVVREVQVKEKAKRKPAKRIPKSVGYRKTFDGTEVILTEKQVDFLFHMTDTCYWDQGADSEIWVDCLCDDIGGQFAGKPMTVGAMISTICEKGLGNRWKEKVNGKTCTAFGLTELGKKVAEDLGV